jgi:integrase
MRSKSKATRYPGVRRVDDATYVVRVKSIDPRTGKTRQVERLVHGVSAHEAAMVRSDLVAELKSPQAAGATRRRLEDYARSWLTSRLPSLKPSTRRRYADVLDLHVVPGLGDFWIDAIGPGDIVTWRDRQVPKSQASTVNSRLRVLKTLFQDAVAELDLPRDPTLRVKALSEASADDDEPNALTAGELGKVLEASRTHEPQWYPMIATLALTGMRFGECAGLRWEDVDEAAGVIRVRRSVWEGKHVTTPKTGKTRTVPLPDLLVGVLREHRRLLVEKQAPGLAAGWVFPSAAGTARYPESLHKPLRRVLKAAKVERHVTVHGLRRTFNNLVRQVTTGEVVRSMTGHVTERMTEHYSHVGNEEKQAAVAKVLVLVSNAAEGADRGADRSGGTKVEPDGAPVAVGDLS